MSGLASSIWRSVNGRQICALLRRRRAVAGRAPRNDVGDIGAGAVEADRRDHQVEQLAGASDEGQAVEVLLASRRLADEHHARAADCRRRRRAAWPSCAARSLRTCARMSRSSSRLAALRAVSRAAITAMSGEAGAGASAKSGARCGGSAAGRRGGGRLASRGRDFRRWSLRGREPIDRNLAERRIHAGRRVEVEQFARRGAAVLVHGVHRCAILASADTRPHTSRCGTVAETGVP